MSDEALSYGRIAEVLAEVDSGGDLYQAIKRRAQSEAQIVATLNRILDMADGKYDIGK